MSLDCSLNLFLKTNRWIKDLYKGCIFQRNPRMFYLGMHDQWYTFNMFDAQAWWANHRFFFCTTIVSPFMLAGYALETLE